MNITNNPSIQLLPRLANRHGLITGSTGSGKTTTLRVMTEEFSKIGVPVFLADVKGDLSGLIIKPDNSPGLPVVFWDIFSSLGHPMRTTIKDIGPLLLARLLDLNKIQTGVITLAFKVHDDFLKDSLMVNTLDLKALLKHLADNAYDYTTEYGNITYTSVGAIQRAILELQTQKIDELLNLPIFDIEDFFYTNNDGKGLVHILNAKIIINYPKLYTTFLLWLLSELYEKLPERGDQEKPIFIFCFDEAHLLFRDISKVLLEKFEQTIRLIRSKGVGIYFITQSPLDIPKSILGQLGNRIQHNLRAYTPEDFTAINKIARTFRQNRNLNISDAIMNMRTGEALVSFLQEDGSPSITEKVFIRMPESRLEPLSEDDIKMVITQSPFFGKYDEKLIDPSQQMGLNKHKKQMDGFAESFGRSVIKSMGNQTGRVIIRGIFNTFFRGIRSGVGR